MPVKDVLDSASPAECRPTAEQAPAASPRILRSGGELSSPLETSCRRTVLAYEPRPGAAPIQRIAVEIDENGQWSVVVDGVLLGEHPNANAAIEYARWLEGTPVLAARQRDGILRKINKGLTSQRGPAIVRTAAGRP